MRVLKALATVLLGVAMVEAANVGRASRDAGDVERRDQAAPGHQRKQQQDVQHHCNHVKGNGEKQNSSSEQSKPGLKAHGLQALPGSVHSAHNPQPLPNVGDQQVLRPLPGVPATKYLPQLTASMAHSAGAGAPPAAATSPPQHQAPAGAVPPAQQPLQPLPAGPPAATPAQYLRVKPLPAAVPAATQAAAQQLQLKPRSLESSFG